MAHRCMERLVCDFHEDDKLRLEHCNDLKCTMLAPFNAIAEGLRKGQMPSFVDTVLGTSKVIEETTLMREQMKDDNATHAQERADLLAPGIRSGEDGTQDSKQGEILSGTAKERLQSQRPCR